MDTTSSHLHVKGKGLSECISMQNIKKKLSETQLRQEIPSNQGCWIARVPSPLTYSQQAHETKLVMLNSELPRSLAQCVKILTDCAQKQHCLKAGGTLKIALKKKKTQGLRDIIVGRNTILNAVDLCSIHDTKHGHQSMPRVSPEHCQMGAK